MVQLLVRVIEAERMLRRREIVAQDKIQLKIFPAAAGDGRDGVVRRAVSLGEDHGGFIGVAAPGSQDLLRQQAQPVRVAAGQAQDGHRPFDDPGCNVRESGKRDRRLDRGLFHGEGVVTALEMVVAQNRAADDGQIRVRAEEIMREQLRKVQQPAERRRADAHGRMLGVEDDAVLVVIDVGGILQIPAAAVQLKGDDAVVLPGGMVHAARVALVFRAQGAFGIAGLRRELGRGDGARVLLGLGEVDGDVQLAVFAGVGPLFILRDAVAADVVGVLAEAVEPVGRLLRGDLVERMEAGADLVRPGRQHPHELRVEQIAGDLIIRADAAGDGIAGQHLQNIGQRGLCRGGFVEGIELQRLEQRVARKDQILRLEEPRALGIAAEGGNIRIKHGDTSFVDFVLGCI